MGDSYDQFIIYIFTRNPTYSGEFGQQGVESLISVDFGVDRNHTKIGLKGVV